MHMRTQRMGLQRGRKQCKRIAKEYSNEYILSQPTMHQTIAKECNQHSQYMPAKPCQKCWALYIYTCGRKLKRAGRPLWDGFTRYAPPSPLPCPAGRFGGVGGGMSCPVWGGIYTHTRVVVV